MQSYIKINLNEKLYLRDPEDSELGRKIVNHSVQLIHEIGFESFTFKKLASKINTVEASVYRYFENKHRLLIYIVDWYWSWLEYNLLVETKNIKDPKSKVQMVISFLASPAKEDLVFGQVTGSMLYDIVMREGAKSYLSRNIKLDNENKLFKPYKDLSACIADILLLYNPKYPYPKSLATTVIEMAHSQNFYKVNLPSLTDFDPGKSNSGIEDFLENLVFSTLRS